ncbi:hypothetical protein CANCADRAFT_18456, partial [Tortispora caseinolytica NRRL Y-17796]
KQERPRKERQEIVDLAKYLDKKIIVNFSGGRQAVGTLKGYDKLMNLVLEDVEESIEGTTRSLPRIIARGPLLTSIAPLDGTEVINNPFTKTDE